MALANGDIRTEARGYEIIERVVATGSLVLKTFGGSRAGEMAAHRFLDSPYVSVETICSTLGVRTAEQCAGRHIIAVQDTTEVNFPLRAAKRAELGTGADGHNPAYFIHLTIAVDAKEDCMLGLLDAHVWTRSKTRASDHHKRTLAEKESRRWQDSNEKTAHLLADAASVTMISDRESDIYDLFALRPSHLDLIVRARHNRALEDGSRLFEALDGEPVLAQQAVTVAPKRIGDKGRTALVDIKAKRVVIRQPPMHLNKTLPKFVEVSIVEACESKPPKGEAPLHWRLLTTHQTDTPQAAVHIVQSYRVRWRIEQTFRALKSDGLKIEESQVSGLKRLFALAAIGVAAAIRTIQLVDARDGNSRPASDVIDKGFYPAIEIYSKKLEGKTMRQQNPHPHGSLAWLAWVVARCGGWNCYYKPPGPKTMRAGWTHLAAVLTGFTVAQSHPAGALV